MTKPLVDQSVEEMDTYLLGYCCKAANAAGELAEQSAKVYRELVRRHSEPIAWLREVDAGTENACWVVCANGDPGAVAVVRAATNKF